jgi:hypothetical protein
VPKSQWEVVNGVARPKKLAFQDPHRRLSVFAADMQTPLDTLQNCIDIQIAKGPDGVGFLNRHGRTPEELVTGHQQWRVASIPLAALLDAGLIATAVEADGHLEVCGELGYEALDRVVRVATVLSAEECLRRA